MSVPDFCNVSPLVLNQNGQAYNVVCHPVSTGPADWVIMHFGPAGLVVILVILIVSPYAAFEIIRKKMGVDILEEFIQAFVNAYHDELEELKKKK